MIVINIDVTGENMPQFLSGAKRALNSRIQNEVGGALNRITANKIEGKDSVEEFFIEMVFKTILDE